MIWRLILYGYSFFFSGIGNIELAALKFGNLGAYDMNSSGSERMNLSGSER
jgi:hypothetical protein